MSHIYSISNQTSRVQEDDDLLFDEQVVPASAAVLADIWPRAMPGESSGSSQEPPPTGGVDARTSPLLEFHRPKLPGDRVPLCWPVVAWRVAATVRHRKSFDFLQMASLRLAQAGVWTAREQANLLSMHEELLERVMKNLFALELLDNIGRLTLLGRNVIDDGTEEIEETRWGWIFQDALAGEILPFLHTASLPFARRDVAVSTTSIEIAALIKSPRRPRPIDLVRAHERWLELELLSREEQVLSGRRESSATSAVILPQEGNRDPDTAVPSMAEREANREKHIRLLEESPQPFQLRVWIDLRGADDGSFMLHSPFGLPDALRWTRLLHFAASQDETIAEVVRRLKAASFQSWQSRQPKPLQPEQLAREAYDELAVAFGPPPHPRWHLLWEELERFWRSRILLRRGFDDADALFTRAQRVLERLLLTWLELDMPHESAVHSYRRPSAHAGPPSDLECLLRDTALFCGAQKTQIPVAILQTKVGSVRRILQGKGLSLNPYAGTLLLAASRHHGIHARTLKDVLSDLPDLFIRIDTVAEARNRYGAHSGPTGDRPDRHIEEIVEHVERCVRTALRVLSQKND